MFEVSLTTQLRRHFSHLDDAACLTVVHRLDACFVPPVFGRPRCISKFRAERGGEGNHVPEGDARPIDR